MKEVTHNQFKGFKALLSTVYGPETIDEFKQTRTVLILERPGEAPRIVGHADPGPREFEWKYFIDDEELLQEAEQDAE